MRRKPSKKAIRALRKAKELEQGKRLVRLNDRTHILVDDDQLPENEIRNRYHENTQHSQRELDRSWAFRQSNFKTQ